LNRYDEVLDSNLIPQFYFKKENNIELSHTMKHKTSNGKQNKIVEQITIQRKGANIPSFLILKRKVL